MTRVTFKTYGEIKHMFIEETEVEAVETWGNLWGRSSLHTEIIHVGNATSTSDFGGFVKQ